MLSNHSPVRGLSLRRARQAMELAIAAAVGAERRFVTREDLAAAVALLRQDADARQPMGFLHRAGRESA